MNFDRRLSPLSRLRGFGRQNAGNVMITFSLLLLPTLGAVGLAVDFGQILTARNKAQMAADAAALQASGVAQELIRNSDGSTAAATASIKEAEKRATLLFEAVADQSGLKNVTPKVTVTRTGQIVKARADYAVTSSNSIANLFGFESYTATGTSVSNASLPTFSDVYLALDTSQSMGIAATQAEMIRLFNAKGRTKTMGMQPTNCVFGCHVPEDGWTESNSAIAKRNGIQLRIDVLRDATKSLIDTAEADSNTQPIYQIAMYGMGMTADYRNGELKTISPLSNNFTALRTAADLIDLGPSPGNGFSDSYQNETLAKLDTLVPRSDDGSTQAKAKKYVMIITDGVRDIQSGSACVRTGNRCVSTVSKTACDAMKAKGVTVGVLYTTYLPPRPYDGNTDWYQVQVVNTGVAAEIATALKACATPGWFYEAADTAGIHAAMETMFKQTQFVPHLTQ